MAQTDTARIFEQSKVGSLEDRYLFTPIAFGCLYSVDKRFKLGEDRFSSFGGEELDLFRLSGAYAGFARMVCGPLVCGRGVKVVDLRTGRTVQDRNPHEADSINSYHASDLVLKDNASLAWIASDEYANPDAHEVRAFDSLGARKLDSGTSIRPKSLELNGSTITWRHGNETRSAILY